MGKKRAIPLFPPWPRRFCSSARGGPARAADKDYHFPDVRIAIQVDRDGTFTVEERRTYDFRGSFSWADLTIPLAFGRHGPSGVVAIEGFSGRG